MTRRYYVQKKAGDLMLGDQFAGWWTLERWCLDDVKPKWPAKRVISYQGPVRSRGGRMEISLDDGSKIQVYPEMLVYVEVLA